MPRLPTASQKIFAGALAASGNIAQPGSTALGSPVYSIDPVTIQALAAYLNGFSAQIVNGTASPVLQEFNALLRLITQQIAYIFENGIGIWTATTTYYNGSFVQDGTGGIYKSKIEDNLNNLLSDTNSWEPLKTSILKSPTTAKAWVMFNGQTIALFDNYNAATVARLGTGNYQITFDTQLDYDNYVWLASCSQDDTVLETVQATRFPGDFRDKTAIQIRTVNSKTGTLVDVGEISLMVFAQ